jgi:hypothetical protein
MIVGKPIGNDPPARVNDTYETIKCWPNEIHQNAYSLYLRVVITPAFSVCLWFCEWMICIFCMQPISSVTVGSVTVPITCNIPIPPFFSPLLSPFLTLIQGVWWVLPVGPSTIFMLFLQYDLPFVAFFVVRCMAFSVINVCNVFAILTYAAYIALMLNG